MTYICKIPARAITDNLYQDEWPAKKEKIMPIASEIENEKLNTWMAVNEWGVNKEGEPHNRYFKPIIKQPSNKEHETK